MNKIRIVVLAVVLTVIAAILGLVSVTSANAKGEDPCVPTAAWTETVEHPEGNHIVHHEAVTEETVVTHDAVTHQETVVDQEATPSVWANFSPDDKKGTFDGPPSYPTDDRGTWQIHNQIPGGHEGPDGVYQRGNGNGDWFYRQAAVAEISHEITVVDAEAWDETATTTVSDAFDELVVDEEAWTETIEHTAIVCDGDTPDPVDPTDPITDPETPVVHHHNPDIEKPDEPNETICFQSFDGKGKLTEQRVCKPTEAGVKEEGM